MSVPSVICFVHACGRPLVDDCLCQKHLDVKLLCRVENGQPRLSDTALTRIRRMWHAGYSPTAIAAFESIPRSTVWRVLFDRVPGE